MADTYGQRLATLDPETGERPSSRLGHAGNARQLVNRLKYEDETRMFRHTKIQGLMDGNPPWNGQKLIDIGQGHRANFNLRESEGIVEAAKTPYYDLVFEVASFSTIEFGIDGAEPHIVQQWSDIITEEYSDTLAGWDGFDHQIQLQQWQMVVNGVGPLFWPHFVGWHSEAIKSRKVLVPQETKANVDDLELAVVLHSYRADELEQFIKRGGTEEPDGDGWNLPLCKQAIIDSAQREMRHTYGIENYDLYQRAIRTGDLYHGIHRSDRIYVASVFVKEFGGKVSHYMITDQNLGHTTEVYDDLAAETGYLFKRRNKFDSFGNVICPFFFDSGPDGTWHAIKGMGPKIYDFCDVSNRTFCQMLDGSVIGSGITLESQDANAIEETQIALVGGAAVVSPGYKVVQTRIAESLEGAMAMRRELHGTLQANTGSYRQRSDEGGRPEPTLGQAELVQQQQGMLTKGSTNRYYNNLDKWHRETLRRLMDPAQSDKVPGGKEALLFKAHCIMRGIPEQIFDFKLVKRVTATRSIGYGSPQLRDIATRELIGLIPYMDEVSRNHALRARAAALPGIGMHSVDSFFPPVEKQGVPNAHASMAVLENNALRQQGGKALVEPMQNHSIHFDVHMQDAMEHIQGPAAAGQNGNGQQPPGQPSNPVEILVHLENAGPHMFKHLEAIKGDPTRKEEIKAKQKAMDQLGKVSDQLHQQLTQSMAAQAKDQAEAPGPMDPKMVKVQGDLQLKAHKQQVDMALKQRKADFQEGLADKKTAAGIQRDTAKTSSDLDNAQKTMSMEEQKAMSGMTLAEQKAYAGMSLQERQTFAGMSQAERKTRHSMSLAERKARHDARIKEKQAAQKPKPQKE